MDTMDSLRGPLATTHRTDTGAAAPTDPHATPPAHAIAALVRRAGLRFGHLSSPTRRDALVIAVTGALGIALSACASKRGGNVAISWPDQEPDLDPLKPIPQPTSPIGGRTPSPSSAPARAGGIIPRSRWAGAGPKMSVSKPMNGIRRITVHHDAYPSAGMWREADVARRIESIRRAHRSRGSEWVDIGYHYVVDPSGRVWEGRPVSIEGAHVSRTNEHNLGICVLGNFDEHRPTTEALATVDSFVAFQMRQHRVSVSNVYTHQELKPTACPGRNLQRYMVETRSRRGRMASA